MRDRSLAVILTVVAVILFGCPGFTVLCLGLVGMVTYYAYGGSYNTNVSPGWVNGLGTAGICVGLFLVVITIIAAFFLLRRKNEPAPVTITPSRSAGVSAPPASPAEPLRPTQPENPPEAPGPDEPIPPSI